MKAVAIASFALVALIAGCSKPEPPPEPAVSATASSATEAPAPAASAPAAAASADTAPADNDGLELQEDLEDRATQEVTAQNLDSELDKVEKEISKGD